MTIYQIKDGEGNDLRLVSCKDNNYPNETFEEEVREFTEEGNTNMNDCVDWLNSKHTLSRPDNPIFERIFVVEVYL